MRHKAEGDINTNAAESAEIEISYPSPRLQTGLYARHERMTPDPVACGQLIAVCGCGGGDEIPARHAGWGKGGYQLVTQFKS